MTYTITKDWEPKGTPPQTYKFDDGKIWIVVESPEKSPVGSYTKTKNGMKITITVGFKMVADCTFDSKNTFNGEAFVDVSGTLFRRGLIFGEKV